MLYTLIAAIRVYFTVVRTGIKYMILHLVSPPRAHASLLPLTRWFLAYVLRLTRGTLVVEGAENLKKIPTGRPTAIISNHESFLDIPVVMGTMEVPVGFIAKKELSRIPVLGYWIRTFGGLFIDRENMRQSLDTLNKAAEHAQVHTLLIFPEGTRNKESTVAPFKTGSLRFAFATESIVVPVCICGGRRKFEGNGYRIKGGPIYLKIFEPVDLSKAKPMDKHTFTASLHRDILAAYREFDSRLRTTP
ncbi:MAG: hypothetical protein A2487_12155 [Candidatus Raymondbacteria bacterium RifOxyC12_full_50_8]|uniref:Phospholipid/glycerol acyltransferase domain-containing protein n=1 Tax=Candidatus Raymondbacteria bacterium RIFOXYD12_FULL_49_13 TaxID=1817890 RepID=A0A1F7FC06_UNCRA|nr:MAG: hypothetical protein A2248_03415 [Candidatus Raymondbacteria bacterium RIFOXYA2_FULL_49_16]OGJ96600.1 MAG: hypothetical protein A2487_12155 [Candidatus Raymondbacteria bacterium RifOxyC12_full_50_8]OGJ99627.1 MAG: hypothetical protein A2350_16070 [Candidatus Raymondbacteria bacterium RifOxyB12_full_50_8]OGK04215.1 MAG: hypothetical protein A2519_17790 [Candidatus Raymondbacteria bacterium RIFOXYD12_FULL_49_13]OGP42503.1 MAG: hypothetical protein A2324_17450 [Candidatus Raymondbacteria b